MDVLENLSHEATSLIVGFTCPNSSKFVSYWYIYLQISKSFNTIFSTLNTKAIHGHRIHFAEEICKQDSNLYLVNLEVNSLLTNIPVDKTIGICSDSLDNDNESPP